MKCARCWGGGECFSLVVVVEASIVFVVVVQMFNQIGRSFTLFRYDATHVQTQSSANGFRLVNKLTKRRSLSSNI